jgi:chromosome partitioning protein
MPVISFINQKGGCGKSTNSVHLAWALSDKKKSVIVIDADAQQSVSRWLKMMESSIECRVIQDSNELVELIPQIAQNYDYVIVDGAGGLSESTRCILLRSDLTIIPVQPTGLDLSSGNDAIRSVNQAQSVRGGLPKLRILLSRAVKGTRLYTEAVQFFKEQPLMDTVIHQRQAIADCFGQGAVAWTLPKDKSVREAIAEFDSLCDEIITEVG